MRNKIDAKHVLENKPGSAYSEEWLVDKIDYAERLFKIKQLEHNLYQTERDIQYLIRGIKQKQALQLRNSIDVKYMSYSESELDVTHQLEELASLSEGLDRAEQQISKLLEDE